MEKDGILYFDVHMSLASEQIPEEFTISFLTPCVDSYSMWRPSIRFDRSLKMNFQQRTSSRFAQWMPLHAVVSSKGENSVLVAVSDAKTPISMRTGVYDEAATIE